MVRRDLLDQSEVFKRFWPVAKVGIAQEAIKTIVITVALLISLLVRLNKYLSELGVPGRRYSLGGFIGVFRFLGRVNHQAHVLVALA